MKPNKVKAVKCVDTTGAKNLTVGKLYHATEGSHSLYYAIINDNKKIKMYHKSRFEIAE